MAACGSRARARCTRNAREKPRDALQLPALATMLAAAVFLAVSIRPANGVSNARLRTSVASEGVPTGSLDVDPDNPEARRGLATEGLASPSLGNSSAPTLVLEEEEEEEEEAEEDASGGDGDGAKLPETISIQPIHIPFIQRPGEWRVPGHGISLDAKGEPKSGTTWLGRLVPQLALELCGNPNNTWCEMGGLVVVPNGPGPRYEFEMIKRPTDEGESPALFLHFKGDGKHFIPGMDASEEHEGCHNGGRMHINFFQEIPPCESDEPPTRARLASCLWDTSPRCISFMPSTDPAVRRSITIVRDPRNVVMSERKMRIELYRESWIKDISVDDFTRRRFEVLVSWTHQRWVWHTSTAMKASSHVVIYEDLKESHASLIGMAAFMGLQCSDASALHVWRSHQNASPHGDYTTHGLQLETVEWMNATMARLLPVPLALRWGITPTDV